jgi:AcrR family transcriptional regulator
MLMSLPVITYTHDMGRWEPGASGRLRKAALELYFERGFEQTTVADIAERAGLTGRTFFRYFADKREVLFSGSERLQQTMVDALGNAPPHATAIEAVAAALDATIGFFADNREFARQRVAVIMANADLRERELIKFATLSAALAEALRSRGIGEPDASLAGEAGIAVFRVAFGTWVGKSERRSFGKILSETLARLKSLAVGGGVASR